MSDYRNAFGSFALSVIWDELSEQGLLDPESWKTYATHQLQDNRYLYERADGDDPGDTDVSDYLSYQAHSERDVPLL